jgi:single-strand DNA-binding protein
MASLNKVMIIGRLGQDIELKYTQSSDAVANLSIATSKKWTDKNGQIQEKTEWHRATMYGKLAEIAKQYLKKGSQVYIEGELQTDKWQDDKGNDKWSTKIVAKEMKMLDTKKSNPTATDETKEINNNDEQF